MNTILEVERINTYYGLIHALHDVSFAIAQGECVALVGRNGAGKTTTFRSIMHLTPVKNGSIRFYGQSIEKWQTDQIARAGVGFVPENRDIFPRLSVLDNLRIPIDRKVASKRWHLDTVFNVFPILRERKHQAGGTLSGGEQQMLTIARSLLLNPDVLLLDEPSEGLAPIIVHTIGTLIEQLKREGQTILLSEQNTHLVRKVADRAYVLDDGRVRAVLTPETGLHTPEILDQYLNIGTHVP